MKHFNEIKQEVAVKQETISRLGVKLKNLIDRFLLCQDIKQNSKISYKAGLKRFSEWIKNEGIQNPTRENILFYKSYLETQNISPLTFGNYLVVIRRFFNWTEEHNLYPNIARGIKGPKHPRGFKKYALTINQIRELLSAIDCSTDLGKRDYSLINLMIRTGLRTIEVVRSNVGDIQQNSGEYVLWIKGKGKDSKDDFILLTEETLAPIRSYLTTREKVTDIVPLFSSHSKRNKGQKLTTLTIRRIVKKYLRKIGLNSKRYSAHSLRHTAITLSLKAGATLQEAQMLARHASITTTLIYAHNLDRISNAPEKKIDDLLSNK